MTKEEKRIYCKKWRENNPNYNKRYKEYQKKWRKDNPEHQKNWCKNNIEKNKAHKNKWRENNREELKVAGRKYYEDNKEKVNDRIEKWQKDNPKKVERYHKRWRDKNPKRVLGYRKSHYSTLRGNLNVRISSAMYRSLKSNKRGSHWENLVGYTIRDLMKHLESLFLGNMSWKNRDKWHIDHKIPVSSFKFKTVKDEGFKKCWSLKNLQPLWAKDNLKKYNKLNWIKEG